MLFPGVKGLAFGAITLYAFVCLFVVHESLFDVKKYLRRNNLFPVRKDKSLKYILMYNAWFDRDDWSLDGGFGQEYYNRCPVKNCYHTRDASLFGDPSQFDAVIVHGVNTENIISDVQKWRKPHQRFVFHLMESPVSDLNNYSDYPDHFYNWTYTYRWDSDIPRAYAQFLPKNHVNFTPSPDELGGQWPFVYDEKQFEDTVLPSKDDTFRKLARRPKKVAWVVSHCKTSSRRKEVVDKLKEYIDVDIMGWCGEMKCGDEARECEDVVREDYKFYLAFENSLCDDYMTEKVFQYMKRDSLVVVLGQGNFTRSLPPHSYINAADFDSSKALADFMLQLDQNEDEYLSYFWWKDHYNVIQNSMFGFCELCAKLHDENEQPKSYENFEKWWRTDAHCGATLPIVDRLVAEPVTDASSFSVESSVTPVP